MRGLLFVLLLACGACYRPSASPCDPELASCQLPDGETASDVGGDGSPTDGPLDAPAITTCVTSTFDQGQSLQHLGTSYSMNGSAHVMFEASNGDLMQIPPPGTGSPMAIIIQGAASSLDRPSMATLVSGNAQVFFVGANQTLVSARHNSGNVWDTVVTQTVVGLTISESFVFGQPTATIPRRAAASVNGVLYEGIESGTTWTFSPLVIPGTTSPIHGNLSKDGLAIVVVDQASGTRLHLAERASVTDAFTMSRALSAMPGGFSGNVQFPSFGRACDRIFVSVADVLVEMF